MNRLFSGAVLTCISFCCFALPAYPGMPDSPQNNTRVTDGPVRDMAVAGGKVSVTGSFTRAGPRGIVIFPRKNIAAIDAANGQPASWDPGQPAGNDIMGIHSGCLLR